MHVLAAAVFGNPHGMTVNDGLIICGVALLISVPLIIRDERRKRKGIRPKPKLPREPRLDVSPFTAGLLGLDDGRAYKPRGITAVTPRGVRVTVHCPHVTGHRSPGLAVACAQREKQRIERLGR